MMDLAVKVGISARHLHITEEHLKILFGEDAVLHPIKELMGGQFAANESVTLIGQEGRRLEKVRILGPLRSVTQVELSKTDTMYLKVQAPLRDSGDLEDAAPITLQGPKGQITLEKACIVPKRHIHMSPKDAQKFGVKDKDLIAFKFKGERPGVMEDVLVRVDKSFTLEMHIDTDEANAFGVRVGQFATYHKA